VEGQQDLGPCLLKGKGRGSFPNFISRTGPARPLISKRSGERTLGREEITKSGIKKPWRREVISGSSSPGDLVCPEEGNSPAGARSTRLRTSPVEKEKDKMKDHQRGKNHKKEESNPARKDSSATSKRENQSQTEKDAFCRAEVGGGKNMRASGGSV